MVGILRHLNAVCDYSHIKGIVVVGDNTNKHVALLLHFLPIFNGVSATDAAAFVTMALNVPKNDLAPFFFWRRKDCACQPSAL